MVLNQNTPELAKGEEGMAEAERIRVLVVCGSLHVGGAEIQAARLIPLLAKEIFDVQVAYYNFRAGFPKDILKQAGVRLHFLGKSQWSKGRFLADAINFMKQERFDLVHAWCSSSNHYGRVPAILTGVPVIIGGLRGKSSLENFWPLVYSLMNWRCSGWIVNSFALKEYAKHKMCFMQQSPVMIVHNGIELGNEERFKKNEKTFYDKLKSNRPVIGIVGRLHPVKNHLLFLEMARLLTQMGVNADYWIIGNGPMRGQIEQSVEKFKLQDRVILLGLRDDVDVSLSRMDVVVLTSDSESCPNALLEAMRASLPVVSTRCSTLDEIVEERRNGYTVPVGDATGLAEKVRIILENPEKRREMGKHSKRIIEKRFSISSAVRSLEDAYLFFLKRESKRHPNLQVKLTRLGLL